MSISTAENTATHLCTHTIGNTCTLSIIVIRRKWKMPLASFGNLFFLHFCSALLCFYMVNFCQLFQCIFLNILFNCSPIIRQKQLLTCYSTNLNIKRYISCVSDKMTPICYVFGPLHFTSAETMNTWKLFRFSANKMVKVMWSTKENSPNPVFFTWIVLQKHTLSCQCVVATPCSCVFRESHL